MLRIPQAITEAMPKGPLAKDAAAMNALFRDPQRTAFVIVTLAEDLPARETSELARIVREGLQLPLGPLVVNGLPPAGPARPEVQAVLARGPTGDAALDAILAGAALLAARREEAEEVLGTLRKDPGLPMIELPRLPTTDLGPAEIDELARYFAT
jgi:hypothetical protein